MDKYFATKESEELAQHLQSQWEKNGTTNNRSGYNRKLAKAYNYYYGNQTQDGHFGFDPGEISSAGSQGELKTFAVNHFRNVIRHILALTTSQRPKFDARAINTDLTNLQRAKLGSNIVDYYMREKKIFSKCKMACEMALVLKKSFITVDWDMSLGRDVGVKTVKDEDGKPLIGEDGEKVEKIIKEGDISVEVHSSLDVLYDKGLKDWSQAKWIEVRKPENKWEVVAQYPEQAEAIKNQTIDYDQDKKYVTLQEIDEDSDIIPIFYFYHKPTVALPGGRLLKRLKTGEILFDGPYPYGEKLNTFRISAGEMFGSLEGYADSQDLIVLQEVLNILESTVFTNQQAFGVQAIAVPEGANITSDQIDGMSFIKVPSPVSENMPKAIQLTASPPEVFKNIENKERAIEKLSGINSTVRGDPSSNLKSGAALARVQAMAIQYASNTQESWSTLLEDVGGFLLHLLKEFAENERLIALSGKTNRGHLAKFKGEDLTDIDGVVVDLGNPLARTVAGKLEIADRVLEKGLVKTPQEYLTVMETGNLDPLIEGPEAELSLIRLENEDMMEGKDAKAIVGDAHLLHMQEHRTLLSNPIVRMDGNMVKTVLGHIQEHMDLYKSQDPTWAAVSGEPPAPQQAPPMPPQGSMQGQGPSGPPPDAMMPPQGMVELAENPMAGTIPPMPMSN